MKLIKSLALIIPAMLFVSGCSVLGIGKNKGSDEIVITEPAAPAQIQSTFLEGDTLWDFAERTTGSGFNWEKIKVLNDIADEKNIDAGVVLLVPPELAIDSLKAQ